MHIYPAVHPRYRQSTHEFTSADNYQCMNVQSARAIMSTNIAECFPMNVSYLSDYVKHVLPCVLSADHYLLFHAGIQACTHTGGHKSQHSDDQTWTDWRSICKDIFQKWTDWRSIYKGVFPEIAPEYGGSIYEDVFQKYMVRTVNNIDFLPREYAP